MDSLTGPLHGKKTPGQETERTSTCNVTIKFHQIVKVHFTEHVFIVPFECFTSALNFKALAAITTELRLSTSAKEPKSQYMCTWQQENTFKTFYGHSTKFM